MLRYRVALAYMFISFIECARALGIGQSLTVPYTFNDEQPVIAPELFRDGSFAFASIERSVDSSRATLVVQIVGKKSSANTKCSMSLTLEANAVDADVSSLRRASEKRVLLTARERFPNGERRATLIWLDLKDCAYSFAHGSFLPDTHLVIPSHNLVSRNQFRVFVSSASFCRGSAWCSFLLPCDELGPDASNIELPWQGTRIESIEDLNVDFYVYHYVDRDAAYRMILGPAQPPKYTRAELLTLARANYSEVMSSQLAVCWTSRGSTANCSKFSTYGRLMFNRTVSFPEPISLLRVKDTRDGLLLFAGKAECAEARCSHLLVARISEGDKALQVNYRASRLHCSADSRHLVFDAREENDSSIKIEYVCFDGDRLTFNDLLLNYY